MQTLYFDIIIISRTMSLSRHPSSACHFGQFHTKKHNKVLKCFRFLCVEYNSFNTYLENMDDTEW